MNSYLHSVSSAANQGGAADDYHKIHLWIDESKSILVSPAHRALRHHAEGAFVAERIFGPTIINSEGRQVLVRVICEEHIKQDLGFIPSFADWAREIRVRPWMDGGSRLFKNR